MLEEIKKKIDEDNEVLNILPQNNLHNRKKYKEKVEELLKEYQGLQDGVYKYIVSKNTLLKNIQEDTTIESAKENIEKLAMKLKYFNRYQKPYEIFNLDQLFYNIHKYYDNDLSYFNDNINKIVNIFEDAKVILTEKDFFFSDSGQKYMSVFLEERKNGNYNSDKVKQTFEELYWSSHNMMRYILLNFKHLYYQNEKKFNDCLIRHQLEVLSDYGNSYDKLVAIYQDAVMNHQRLIDESKYLYYQKFMNKELNPNDFEQDKMEKLINNFVSVTETNNTRDIFNKFYYSLKEEKFIRNYEFILDDINKLREDKDNNKNLVNTTLKEIATKEKNIYKKRKKINHYIKWKKLKKIEPLSNEIETILGELDESYNLLDENKNKEIISQMTNPTIEDYFEFAKSFIYLRECMKRNEKEDVNINNLITDFSSNIVSPYNTIMKNISYSNLENLNYIVYDKYRLLGLNLNVDDFNTDNLENYINTIESIVTYYNLLALNINLDEVDFVLKSNEIMKNKGV